jgi:hypothetical protein
MQQPARQSPAPQATAPATPTAPRQFTVPGPNGTEIQIPIPMTRAEVNALQRRRSELSTQLNSAQGRRDDLAQQLADPKAVDKPGLEARIKQLDDRILNIENQIAENGQQLASIPANMRPGASSAEYGPVGPMTIGAIRQLTGLLTVALLVPFAVVWARRMWRRDSEQMRAPAVSPRWDDNFNRLERLEDAIGAIATEVERVSEGQRFITQALAPGDGAYEPIRAGARVVAPVTHRRG